MKTVANKELLQSWVNDGFIIVVLEGRGLLDWGLKFYLGVEAKKVDNFKVGQLLMPWNTSLGKKAEIMAILDQVPEEMTV